MAYGGSTPSDDLLRLALDAAPAAILIVDGAGKIIFLNGQAEKLFGYPVGFTQTRVPGNRVRRPGSVY